MEKQGWKGSAFPSLRLRVYVYVYNTCIIYTFICILQYMYIYMSFTHIYIYIHLLYIYIYTVIHLDIYIYICSYVYHYNVYILYLAIICRHTSHCMSSTIWVGFLQALCHLFFDSGTATQRHQSLNAVWKVRDKRCIAAQCLGSIEV